MGSIPIARVASRRAVCGSPLIANVQPVPNSRALTTVAVGNGSGHPKFGSSHRSSARIRLTELMPDIAPIWVRISV